jgi:hypothetical protein
MTLSLHRLHVLVVPVSDSPVPYHVHVPEICLGLLSHTVLIGRISPVAVWPLAYKPRLGQGLLSRPNTIGVAHRPNVNPYHVLCTIYDSPGDCHLPCTGHRATWWGLKSKYYGTIFRGMPFEDVLALKKNRFPFQPRGEPTPRANISRKMRRKQNQKARSSM